MIRGTGIDLVDIERLERILARWGEKVTSRLFTPRERRYCDAHSHPAQHYAARIAVKESCLKALGVGMGTLSWQEIEVAMTPAGQPQLQLSGKGKRLMGEKGIKAFSLSLSHTASQAVAIVIALGEEG